MTPSDLDEIRKRCEGPGRVECGTPDSATDDAKALLDEVERLQRENSAHRALAMLEPKEMGYADRSEFERLKRADVEQGKRVAELTAEVERLHSFEQRVMPLADLEVPGMSIYHDDAIDRLRDRLALLEPVWEAAKAYSLGHREDDLEVCSIADRVRITEELHAAVDAAVAKEGK